MPYDSLLTRVDVQALIPEEISTRFLTGQTEESMILRLASVVPMGSAQQRMPVLSALPVAYFVGGDTGLKQTSEMAWANKFLNVEEIAVIIPIPEAVLEDVEFDLEAAIRPQLETAIGRTLDAAVFFGTNKPASWPDGIVTGALAVGVANFVHTGTATAAEGGLAEDINQLMSLVEADGFDVTGIAANRSLRGALRGARNANGDRFGEVAVSEAYGVPIAYGMRGLWPTGLSAAIAIAGDFKSQTIVGIRRDITYKALDQAVIQDETGAIVYNLAQQDMVAIRVTFRVAWQVSNLLTFEEAVEANRFPFAVLRNPVA
jgi:HK97 family phage major capsid protein